MTHIVVAGAGIGGLSAAVALAGAGMEVTLCEQAARLEEVGAGLQIAPNATRALRALGLLDQIAAKALRPEGARIRRGRDGTELARLAYGVAAERRYGAPFLVAHRADLHSVLLAAARAESRIRIATGTKVVRSTASAGGVAIKTEAAGQIDADGLVGADGLRSVVRSALHPDGCSMRSSKVAWRTLVPAERVPEPARAAVTQLWLGRDLHLVHYPVRGATLVNVIAVVEQRWDAARDADLWTVPGDAATIAALFRPWCREARALIEAAEDWRCWPLFDRAPLPFWSKGALTLLGDAAHPMLPFLAQGASQAIEDAAALGEAARRAGPDPAAAFCAYERARRPKADRVQRASRQQGTIYHLGGPAAVARDLTLRALGSERLLKRYDDIYRA